MNIRFQSVVTVGSLLALCAGLVASDAAAVGTRSFRMDSLDSFSGGDLTGVAVTSDGTVRAGWTLANTPITDATSVWSSAVLSDGTVLLGTGAGGRIYKVKNGKVSIAAETGTMAVSALAIGFGGEVIAGTFPGGKLFKVAPDKLDGSKLKPWVELKDADNVWSLAFDAKKKALFAATGPNGKLFRVTANGRAEVFFDSEEAHLVSVALGPGGTVYTGSNGNALLYKLTGPGRATVMHDFEGTDVKAIAVAPADKGGAVYAVSNSYRGSVGGSSFRRSGSGLSSGPSPMKQAKGGRGTLVRFDKSGAAETMYKDTSSHLVSLVLDDAGLPIVGTGVDGKVYSIDNNHVTRLLVDTEERQIGAIAVNGPVRFVVGSDPVVFHNITGSGGAEAIWTSKVLDAGLRAHFGMLEWTAEGTLELQTRSGNTQKPDKSWGPWSASMSKPGKVKSDAARFLQVRALFKRDPKAALHEVKISFVTDNMRPLLTEVKAGDTGSNTGGSRVPASGTSAPSASTKVKVSWRVDNPDNDKLRYRLYYRPVGGKNWFTMLQPGKELTSTSYSWETTGVPEGRYRIRVDVSDELSNPPDRVRKHSLESRTVVVDNTPPVISKLTLRGTRLSGEASDGVGPISRIEVKLVGGEQWFPLYPTDKVFDEAKESFDTDIANLLPEGVQLVAVRVYDKNGNEVTRTATRTK